MKLGVVIPTYDDFGDAEVIRTAIRKIEDLGYDSAWFGDHIVVPEYAAHILPPNWYEAVSCALVGIGMTTKLAFGTDVLVAPYRSPLLLAKMAATASELSSGRFMLGLGIGYLKGEFEALGIPPYDRRGSVTNEYLKVMRALFEANGPVSYAGEWIRFENALFGPKPHMPPPLLVGGNNVKAYERAGRFGDGWHPLFATPEAYAEGRKHITAIRTAEGLQRPFLYSYSCPQTSVLADGAARPVEQHLDFGGVPAEFGYAPPSPRTPQGRLRFIGTAEEILQDLRDYADAGVEQLVLRFASNKSAGVTPDQYLMQLQRFAHDVLPHIDR